MPTECIFEEPTANVFPASYGQRGLWFINRLDGPNPVYNVPVAVRLTGHLDLAALRAALDDLVERHETLRTSFQDGDGYPEQIVKDSCTVAYAFEDLSELPEADRERQAEEVCRREAEKLFNLTEAPLWRLRVLKVSYDEHFLCAVLHHIIADGVSVYVFFRDLTAFYGARLAGHAAALPELPIQFADFACWEADAFEEGQHRERLIGYWKKRLRDLPSLPLPCDHPRREEFAYQGRTIRFPLDETESLALESFARKCGVTPFVAWLGVLQVLLSEWTGATDIPIGVPVENRDRPELRELIGLLVNTLVVRAIVNGGTSFVAHAQSLQSTFRQDLIHRELPLEMVAQALSPARQSNRTALFQVMFAFQQEPEKLPVFPGTTWEPVGLELRVAHFDLHFEVAQARQKFLLNIEYCTDLFEPETVTRLGKRFQELMVELVSSPDRSLREILAERAVFYKARCAGSALPSVPPNVERNEAPLSYHQERLWFIDRFETGKVYPSHPSYHNIPLLLECPKALNREILELSLEHLARRHRALRTRLRVRNELPFQAVAPSLDLRLETLAKAENRDIAVVRAVEFTLAPFDLEKDLLLRAAVIPFADDRELLVLATHHLVADKRSLEILARDLGAIYESFRLGSAPSLEPVQRDYLDVTLWERDLPSVVLDNLRAFWSLRLSGPLRPLELPTDRPRHAVHIYRQERLPVCIDAPLRKKLVQLAKESHADLESVLFTAFHVLLYRYSQHCEIVTGLSEPNRVSTAEACDLVGPLANLLVLRQRFSQTTIFSAAIGETLRQIAEARAHAAMPFDLLVRELNPEKDMSRTALFDVLFQFDPSPGEVLALEGAAVRLIDTHLGFGKYDLNLFLRDRENEIAGQLVYNGELFDLGTVERMLVHWRAVLEAVARDYTLTLAKIPLLSCEESVQLESWNRTDAEYPRAATIHGLFAVQAKHWPDRIAVCFEDRRLTYAALDAKANRLAHRLKHFGITRDQLVAVCLHRSENVIVAFLAILKAGGAYLPLEPDLPELRLRHILQDAGVKVLLFERALPRTAIAGIEHCLSLGGGCDWFPNEPETPPENSSAANDLAYCIYTSGSTGHPKGVLVEHRNVVRLLVNDHLPFRFDETDIWSLFHSPCFDFSVWEMYGALLYGGRVVIVPEAVAQSSARFLELLSTEKVTVLNQTPTAFYHLADEALIARPALALRYVIFGGEALNPLRVKRFHAAYPEPRLVNMYGITETTVHVTFKELTDSDFRNGASNVGCPIPTTACYILDGERNPVPIGIQGEIYVGGAGVARGYLNREELTEAKFVQSPFRAGERLYRSGDLGKFLPNGEIVYLGRLDAQVQVRGFRVELGEVQVRLLQHPAVRDAVVTARPLRDGSTGLFAYVVPTHHCALQDLRGYLRETLPDYMIPSAFIPIETLPMTANGKAALDALPDPSTVCSNQGGDSQSTSLLEQRLAGIWASALGCEPVELDDDFFNLGGYSLLATRLLSRVHQELGVEIPLRALFDAPRLRDFARRVADYTSLGEKGAEPALVCLPRDGHLPPSPMQTRLWFIDRLEKQSSAYHLFGSAKLKAEPNLACLRRALAVMQSRHESLRTGFHETEGRLTLRLHPAHGIQLPLEDLSHWPEEDREARYRLEASEFARRRFDLDTPPLVRASLFHLGPNDTRFVVGMHHIIADGWSLEIFMREVSALYEAFVAGRPSPLKELSFQFCDLAAWQEKSIDNSRKELLLAHWTARLRDVPPLELPSDLPRPEFVSDAGAMHPFILEAPLVGRIRDLALEHRASPFMVGMAAFQLLLARVAGKRRFAVGFPVANRNRAEAQEIIGCFVNTLALPVDVDETGSFEELLALVRERTFAAHAHQDLPFEALVDALNPPRDLGRHPIFQVLFNFQETFEKPRASDLFQIEDWPIDTGAAQFDLALYLEEGTQGSIRALFVYRADLFKKATIERFATQYYQILEHGTASVQQPLHRVPLLSPKDAERRVVWNSTQKDRSAESLHGLFEVQAKCTPEMTAAQFEEKSLTYAELDRASSRVAALLREKGVQCESVVGICLERSLEMIVGLLGILKAGAAYLPLDPELPIERLRGMMEIAGTSVVITVPAHRARLSKIGLSVFELNLNCLEGLGEFSSSVDPLAAAYVLFTSGSTGRPKGVVISHLGICNRLLWMQETYQLEPSDRVLQKTSFTFDVSLWEFFWPIITGAGLVLARPGGHRDPGYLVRAVNEFSITTLHFVPPMLDVFLQHPGAVSCVSLRRVICSGEVLSRASVQRFHSLGLRAELYNLYGPTEASVDVSAGQCVPDDPSPTVPIGRPIANTQLHILDAHYRPVGIGVPGELFIGGICLARGYINMPGLTAAAFVPDSVSNQSGARLYRTGDRARFREDGAIEFLGRLDRQVKIRGFRIEPGEIECLLAEQPCVREVAVLLRPESERLAAYVVLESAETPEWQGTLVRALEERVPEYMIPADWVRLECFPVTSHGKIDRAALPAPVFSERSRVEHWIPKSTLESAIADVWSGLLLRDNIGRQENFFDAGGNSLLLIQAHLKLRERLQVPIELIELFRHPTIASLATVLSRTDPSRTPAQLGPQLVSSLQARDIAIIGMAGRFPEARDLVQFWENLAAGRECIRFFTSDELLAAGVEPAVLANPDFVPAGGVLDDVDLFDAAYFGYSPADAALLDPQGRVFLECADEALQSAGIQLPDDRERIGVFAGSSLSTYLFGLLSTSDAPERSDAFAAVLGNDKDYLTTRVSYKLGLRGPSVAVQTACSTSLVAVHLACQSLRRGECEVALAGGVSIAAGTKPGYFYEDGGILSPDGHCRAFDASAQGVVMGEGCGIVVLKPLNRALEDGDVIHAVIKGSAVNNDGRDKVGFTAPSFEGQTRAIREALADAGVTPSSIGYVETHGTGTPLGDLIEISALKAVFGGRSAAWCAIGSVKSSIGHLDAAAGVAGLIKTVLALKNGFIPPSLNCLRPNPALAMEGSALFVNTELRPWQSGSEPRRAGVSSFGIGGSNAHVVLEVAPHRASEPCPVVREEQLLVLTAHTPEALTEWSHRIAEFCAKGAPSLKDLAYTLQTGRRRLSFRCAIVAKNIPEAIAALRSECPACPPLHGTELPGLAFLFPGQGGQTLRMGSACYASEPIFRETVDRCLAALSPDVRGTVFRLFFCGADHVSEDSELANRTEFAQPGLLIYQVAMTELWLTWGVRPQAVLGHSLGEYAAGTVAGVFSPEAGAVLAAERGRLCQALAGGAMLAVGLGEADLLSRLPRSLDLAAVNAEDVCIVSGPKLAVAEWAEELRTLHIPSKFLTTDRAFHSRAMQAALPALKRAAEKIQLRPPSVPFFSTRTGAWAEPGELEEPTYWAEHLRDTVRFSDGIDELAKAGRTLLLEIGPGEALTKLVRRRAGLKVASAASAGHPIYAAAKLWPHGVELDWDEFHSRRRTLRISLPGYPYERKRCWRAEPASGNRGNADAGLFQTSWTCGTHPGAVGELSLCGREFLFSEQPEPTSLAGRIADALRRHGASVVAHAVSSQYALSLPAIDGLQRTAVFVSDRSQVTSLSGFYRLLRFVRILSREGRLVQLTIVTESATALTGGPEASSAALHGLALVIGQEHPQIDCQVIDIDSEATGMECLIAAISNFEKGRRAVLAGRALFESGLIPLELAKSETPAFRKQGVYLITGGLGKMGRALARRLARDWQARLVLSGRAPAGPDCAALLAELRSFGADAVYLSADLGLDGAARRTVVECIELFGRIDGVFHAAGVAGEDACFSIDDAEPHLCETVFGPKVAGTEALIDAVRGLPVNFFAACSSLATELGGLGFGAYAAANAALDSLIEREAQFGTGARWLSIGWDGWDFSNRLSLKADMPAFTTEAGLRMWETILSSGHSGRVLAVAGNLQSRLATWVLNKLPALDSNIKPLARKRVSRSYEEPRTPLERAIAGIWMELLGSSDIGIHDDFLELGGHSLLATRMLGRIASRFLVRLSLRAILEASTVARLAKLIESSALPMNTENVETAPREEGEL